MRVLSHLFRRLFLEALQHAFNAGALRFVEALAPLHDPQAFASFLRPLRETDWVVYAKAPFGGPSQVLDWIGDPTGRHPGPSGPQYLCAVQSVRRGIPGQRERGHAAASAAFPRHGGCRSGRGQAVVTVLALEGVW